MSLFDAHNNNNDNNDNNDNNNNDKLSMFDTPLSQTIFLWTLIARQISIMLSQESIYFLLVPLIIQCIYNVFFAASFHENCL